MDSPEEKVSGLVSPDSAITEDQIRDQIDGALVGAKKRRFLRFVMAALGSIPWVGGFIGASAALHAESEQGRMNELHHRWLEEHKQKLHKLAEALGEILHRLEALGPVAEERANTEDYLALVRKGFMIWNQADTEEKRTLVTRLLTNAAGTTLCTDDLVRLFLDWIDHYHETHFMVIREVYQNPGITRGAIWDRISGERPRDDSSEADLFRLLIDDLSQGRIIRQHRETTSSGQFIAKRAARRAPSGGTLKSAFDEIEPYELTELGKQFVHYAMNDVVPRIGSDAPRPEGQ